MASATDSTRTPSRRAFFAHAALSGVAAVQPPIFVVAAPSTLALACDAAIAHLRWVNNPEESDANWPDDRLETELGRFNDVLARAAEEPALSIDDLRAKARLILADSGENLGMSEHAGDRATLTLLKEVAALSA